MIVYIIYGNNQEQYKDYSHQIEEEVYLDKGLADKDCYLLNNPVFKPSMTKEEFDIEEASEANLEYKKHATYESEWGSYEDFVEYEKGAFERDKYFYEVKEHQVKT